MLKNYRMENIMKIEFKTNLIDAKFEEQVAN